VKKLISSTYFIKPFLKRDLLKLKNKNAGMLLIRTYKSMANVGVYLNKFLPGISCNESALKLNLSNIKIEEAPSMARHPSFS